ncbi:MarR family transcriptional regulator [Telmatospirillum sp.]|uniref:MarR family winged helix-turn-helix transcriptional regulator n=1 Tax=Telmatospirillum sp. TaxID=2079197 RepID=UPI00284C8425|nr:MarR family transcriptional regulator [Telmatospirillum sp.]MDR3439133.1 MarR family transcriptional regulator [Telmatospirillum sp.]
MRDTDLTLGEFLCFAIYSAGHAFNRVYKPLLDRLGLTYPQYLVMVALWNEDGLSVGKIGEKLFLESNTLTPLLKRLESNGYLRRTRNPADERQVQVRLTEQGKALKQRASEFPSCIVEASGQKAADLQKLRDEIFALRDALDRFDISALVQQPSITDTTIGKADPGIE